MKKCPEKYKAKIDDFTAEEILCVCDGEDEECNY